MINIITQKKKILKKLILAMRSKDLKICFKESIDLCAKIEEVLHLYMNQEDMKTKIRDAIYSPSIVLRE